MIDAAVSRTNFQYATKLRAKGFLTAVHALPQEARRLVDELLEKGQPAYHIANQLNAKFNRKIEKLGHKPISSHAILSYRLFFSY